LLTTNSDKAKALRSGVVTNDRLASILGLQETKAEAAASGRPTVVQGTDNKGNVVAEAAASPQGVPAAAQVIGSQAPNVRTVSPEEALARRAQADPQSVDQGAPSTSPTKPEPLTKHPVDKAAAKAAANPSPAQSAAGNYAMGHLNLHGLDVSIETPRGGV